MKTYTINETGLNEIKTFLTNNHRLGGNHFSNDMIHAWAEEAEFQLNEGNDASIEIIARDCIHGRTVTYTISDAGLDSEEVVH